MYVCESDDLARALYGTLWVRDLVVFWMPLRIRM